MPKFADRECKVTPARVWRRCSADCKKKRRCPSNHFTKSLGPWTGSGWKQRVALFGLARTPLLHTSRKATLSDPSSAASCHQHSQRQEDSRKPSPRLIPKHIARRLFWCSRSIARPTRFPRLPGAPTASCEKPSSACRINRRICRRLLATRILAQRLNSTTQGRYPH